jgi:hypothetical protein
MTNAPVTPLMISVERPIEVLMRCIRTHPPSCETCAGWLFCPARSAHCPAPAQIRADRRVASNDPTSPRALEILGMTERTERVQAAERGRRTEGHEGLPKVGTA